MLYESGANNGTLTSDCIASAVSDVVISVQQNPLLLLLLLLWLCLFDAHMYRYLLIRWLISWVVAFLHRTLFLPPSFLWQDQFWETNNWPYHQFTLFYGLCFGYRLFPSPFIHTINAEYHKRSQMENQLNRRFLWFVYLFYAYLCVHKFFASIREKQTNDKKMLCFALFAWRFRGRCHCIRQAENTNEIQKCEAILYSTELYKVRA